MYFLLTGTISIYDLTGDGCLFDDRWMQTKTDSAIIMEIFIHYCTPSRLVFLHAMFNANIKAVRQC